MLAVEGDKKMYFAGSDKPLAMAEVSLYGAADGECYNRLTGKITEILSKVLSVLLTGSMYGIPRRNTGDGMVRISD